MTAGFLSQKVKSLENYSQLSPQNVDIIYITIRLQAWLNVPLDDEVHSIYIGAFGSVTGGWSHDRLVRNCRRRSIVDRNGSVV